MQELLFAGEDQRTLSDHVGPSWWWSPKLTAKHRETERIEPAAKCRRVEAGEDASPVAALAADIEGFSESLWMKSGVMSSREKHQHNLNVNDYMWKKQRPRQRPCQLALRRQRCATCGWFGSCNSNDRTQLVHLRMGSQRSVLSQVRFGLSPRLEGISEVLYGFILCPHMCPPPSNQRNENGNHFTVYVSNTGYSTTLIECVHIVCSIAT